MPSSRNLMNLMNLITNESHLPQSLDSEFSSGSRFQGAVGWEYRV